MNGAESDLLEDEVRERVIEAHKVLMRLNEQNRETFKDLVSALEEEAVSRQGSSGDDSLSAG